jgi:uncharacterized protein (TIGR00255 family)
MTGYARAEGGDDALGWTWEAKSVNGRGFDLRCRLPTGYDVLEIPAREAAQRLFKRGNLSLALAVRTRGSTGPLAVNEARLAQLASLAAAWHRRLPDFRPPSIDGLLALRGVLEASATEDDTAAAQTNRAPMLATLEEALALLAKARAAEGVHLADSLAARLVEIEALIARAAETAKPEPGARRERLREQVRALIDAAPALPEDRLLAEAALLAAKGDVAEEIERLHAHVAAARELLETGEAVGRRLDFLCQEFNREANTLCSKAADLALTKIGLDLKATIEQFREQVQNVE